MTGSPGQPHIADGRVIPEDLDLLESVAHYARFFLETPRPVRPRDPERLGQLLGGELPKKGNGEHSTLRRLVEAGESGLLPSGDSHSFGYVVGGALPIGIASDWLVSLWDQCAAVYETSPLASVAEQVCERWLVDLFELPAGTIMGLTSGCTTANLACLSAARQQQLRAAGCEVNEQGMRQAPPLSVLAGQHTHVSGLRCLRLLGLGGQIDRVDAGADYLQTTERTGRDPMDHRVEISQRARALTLWAILHHEGRDGIARIVERNCSAARELGHLLAQEPGIDLLTAVTLNQVLLHIGEEDRTRRVVETLNSSGSCWVTPTTWDGHSAVRISVSNWQSGWESAEATAVAFLQAYRDHTEPGSEPVPRENSGSDR